LLNFEKEPEINLTISVKDAKNDSVVAARSSATIIITDVNEKPELVANTYFAFKNESVGTVLGSIFIKEEDKSQTHTFSIKFQPAYNLLNINSSTGALTLASLPGSVSTDSITFIVTVKDNGNPQLLDEKEYTLKILENPSPVSVKSLINDNFIRIFPNPASNMVQVTTTGLNKNAYLKIIDIKGVVVNTLKIKQDITIVNTSQLKNGLYYFQIINGNMIVGAANMIIRK